MRVRRPSRRVLAPGLALSIALAWSADAVADQNPFALHQELASYVPGELIVKFRPEAKATARSSALASQGATTLRSLPIAGVRLVRLAPGTDVPTAARELAADPAVDWAEPNVYEHGGSLPDDPLIGQQWALDNSGQTVNGHAGTPDDDIRAPEAWARTTGSHDVLVGVVDSGIDFHAPDLAPNIAARGYDFVQDDDDPSDAFGHGTHVAGIIGARGNDGVGVAGVDWNASILPVRVLNNLNVGTCDDIASGLAYAAASGARVINESISGTVHCQAEEDAIAAYPNTLFVTIAGNDGESLATTPTFPCTDPEPNLICVAASDENDQLASFSNFGPGVDLAAPGTDIKSTFPRWGPLQVLYRDGFESPLAWTRTGAWDRTIQNPHDGVFSLTDTPFANYANNSYTYAQRTLDLTGRDDCAVDVQADTRLGAGDWLLGEVLPDGTKDAEIGGLSGTSGGYQEQYFDLAPLEGRSNGTFRFSLQSDGAGVGDGAYLDGFSVVCAPVLTDDTGAAGEYAFDWGTSMAAPYVTGTAALLLSVDPSLSPAQVKARILSTVDPRSALAGKVETGGRLDAGRAVAGTPAPVISTPSPAVPSHAPAAPAPPAQPDLGAGLAALRKALAGRTLARRGRVTVSLQAPGAGRYSVTLRGVASGSASAPGPGRVALTLRLSARGRRAVRRHRRERTTLTLAFTPAGGQPVSRSTRLRLR